jgi:S-sulfo-L-cysteine synthase (O-acetyl-L-serine-dependent)
MRASGGITPRWNNTREHGADILQQVGNTPLVWLRNIGREYPNVDILAKAEYFNPGGSVKDRPALNMILDGEERGALKPGKVILDATSGNTGIAYAMIGAARGYRVQLCLPANANQERKRILRAYGAELVLTDPGDGSDGAIREARRRYAERPEIYFYPDQYSNPANWQAHYNTTGPEIWRQTEGKITHFVSGLGTTGTVMGVGRRLKEYSAAVRIHAFQPDAPFHGLEGLKHLETAIVPGIYDASVIDQQMEIGTEEAYDMCHRLAREEGLLVGISAAAGCLAATKIAATLTEGVIVTILCDGGDRYLSERLWDEDASVVSAGDHI